MGIMIFNVLRIAFIISLLQLRTKAELFTAIAHMEPLLETQKIIIDNLDKYIMNEEKKIDTLKSHLQLYKIKHEKIMENIPNYLGNPISAFTLIRRLTTGLDTIDDIIKLGTAHVNNIKIRRRGVKYPTMVDLEGAAQALTRLQSTYRLEVRELSEGILNGVQLSRPMTAADCFELARTVYNLKDYNNTIAWSMEALRKFKREKNIGLSLLESDILEYIIFAHFFIGDVKAALEWTNALLALDPNHPRALGNISHFRKIVKEQKERKKNEGGRYVCSRQDIGDKNITGITDDTAWDLENYKLYEALCRGEARVSSKMAKRLSCRYLTEHHPFLRLAPIKVEQLYINPDVYLFHQVISDKEIEFIKKISVPRLRRAKVRHPGTGVGASVPYRISKSVWLHDSESMIIGRLSQRVADMTGLSLRSAEDFQVINYGIGGHYEPHYDFTEKSDNFTFVDFMGNRIATVLFYMSEVAQGGATVFTELGLSVFPVKHAALFWMNLHPSGEGDMATAHASCPVLSGSKWVCNKWLHQVGQELLKPCNLEYQEEGIIPFSNS